MQHLSSVIWLLVATVQETVENVALGRPPFRLSIFFQQTDRAGVGSLPLVSLVSFFLGLTMALLTGYQLRTFGTERLVPGLVAVGFTRELGPLAALCPGRQLGLQLLAPRPRQPVKARPPIVL